MELSEIDKILAKEATPLYKGTFAKDQLSSLNLKDNFAIVVNTSTSRGKGPIFHWVTIYKKKNKVILFDPLAINPEDTYFRNFFLKLKAKKILCLTTPIQQIHSSTCGMYCVLCILYLKHSSFRKFLSIFNTTNLPLNDSIVCSVINKHFNIPKTICDL